MANYLERFETCMEYASSDARPNHELGVWPQTRQRWLAESSQTVESLTWNWFYGEDILGLDRRDYVPIHFGFIPPYEAALLESNERYEIVRNAKGIVTKALKEGAIGGGRMCMDQYLSFPVSRPEDFPAVKARLHPAIPERYPSDLDSRIAAWQDRDCPLILGQNCAANGFYWRAREFMGTEALSYAWYDYPGLMHEMMEFFADFIIETSRPVLEKIRVDYFTLNEDMSMKSGPLLSPDTYRTFIFPHLKRMVEFFRSYGVPYFAVDTDGNPTDLIPLLMDAGVNVLWPLERASEVDPRELRRQFGRELRLWGGVDKRVLVQGPAAIQQHLLEFAPLIEEGGFIPSVDHTVPPDVSWDNFRYYMDAKHVLLRGEMAALEA